MHVTGWPQDLATEFDEPNQQRWATFLSIRDVVMKALEEQRSRGVIGSPLEARVTLLVADQQLRQLCEAYRETLAEAFVVSDMKVQESGSQGASMDSHVPGLIGVQVERAPGQKCQRCWKYLTSVGSHAAHPQLCERCARVVSGFDHAVGSAQHS